MYPLLTLPPTSIPASLHNFFKSHKEVRTVFSKRERRSNRKYPRVYVYLQCVVDEADGVEEGQGVLEEGEGEREEVEAEGTMLSEILQSERISQRKQRFQSLPGVILMPCLQL